MSQKNIGYPSSYNLMLVGQPRFPIQYAGAEWIMFSLFARCPRKAKFWFYDKGLVSRSRQTAAVSSQLCVFCCLGWRSSIWRCFRHQLWWEFEQRWWRQLAVVSVVDRSLLKPRRIALLTLKPDLKMEKWKMVSLFLEHNIYLLFLHL